MRLALILTVTMASASAAGVACAQTETQGWARSQTATWAASAADDDPGGERNLSPWVASTRVVWMSTESRFDRFGSGQAGVSYMRDGPSAVGRTRSGLEISLTPHAGLGLDARGGAAEAGATLRVGRGVSDDFLPDGQSTFGERMRWYVYAAGSGRAVGYNFARDRDGSYSGSGYSHDTGVFMGDAQIGVAFRRGAMQSSIGVVYREIEPGALRRSSRFDDEVREGLIAFQFSIKPE